MNPFRKASLWLVLALAFFINACRHAEPVAAPPPKVTVSKPVVREVIEWDEYTGRLESTESVEMRARVLQSIHFKDGAIVKKGDLLFVIDPRPYQAEVDRATAELQLAQARLELAKSDYARAQKLLEFRAISQEKLTPGQRRSDRPNSQSQPRGPMSKRQNLEFTRVTAPITGRISRKLVTEGNLINGGTAESTPPDDHCVDGSHLRLFRSR